MLNNVILNYNNEPGLSYFKEQIGASEHTSRIAKVNMIQKHLLRNHSVNQRTQESFNFKGKTFVPAAIVLQSIKAVVNFHTAYLVGNPVSITGTPEIVAIMNDIYRKGTYSKTDWQILNDIITYGNAFEYNNLQLQQSLGLDTSEAQQKVNDLAQQIQSSDNDYIVNLALNDSSVEELNASISALRLILASMIRC